MIIKKFGEYITELSSNELKITINKKTIYDRLYITLIEYLFDYFNIYETKKFKLNIVKPNNVKIGYVNLGNKFKPEIIVSDAMPQLMLKSIIHEFTHFKQIIKKELFLENDEICFKDFKIKISEYNNISKKVNDTYLNLPWELEADNNMLLLKEKFLSSNQFLELREISPTYNYIIDNLF